jgi:hypothetical protein
LYYIATTINIISHPYCMCTKLLWPPGYRAFRELQITRLKRFAAEHGRAGVDVAVPARLPLRELGRVEHPSRAFGT